MSLKQELKDDLKTAMREKNIIKRDSIRAVNTMIKQIEVDERIELNDEEVVKLIQKGIKQREESVNQYTQANRHDLAEKEQNEINVFKKYLPKQLTDEELEEKMKEIIEEVKATSMKDIGKVMAVASKKLAGITDGKRINQTTKKLLG